MVNNNIPTLNIEGKLIIFPLYTYYLQKQGCQVIQRNDKLSNRKLNEYLMQANFQAAMSNEVSLPHFSVYADGAWKEYRNISYQAVRLDAGKYGTYLYYPEVLNQYDEKSTVNMIVGFLSLYSSAKLKIVQR